MNYVINVFLLTCFIMFLWIFYKLEDHFLRSILRLWISFLRVLILFFYLHVQNPLLRYNLKIASSAIVKQKYRKVEVKL